MSYYVGVDPGLSGAIAIYNAVTGDIEAWDMPTFTVKSNGKNRRKLDYHGLATIGSYLTGLKVEKVLIEQVSAMPGQGVTSMFSFGAAAGAAEMMVAGAGLRYDTVTPVKWKKAMRISGNKDESRRAALRLFPRQRELFARVKDDGRAEAALIAYYAAGGGEVPRLRFSTLSEMF